MMTSSAVESSRIDRALRTSPIPALRRLRAEESEFEVVLSGCLPSYYLKQLAQETLMPLMEGRELRNQVEVVRM